MELLLGIVIVVTCWMVVRIIRSSKNQEGYKRWRAGNYASENPYAKEKASGPLSQGLFSKRVRTTGVRRFDDGAIRWCANLLATEESRLGSVGLYTEPIYLFSCSEKKWRISLYFGSRR
ncbi:hypothetical protein HMPREF0101_00093 [Bacteroides fragilis]|nr:hypothetical protein HMPREF0101_00093 [Bacteroides fragilis]